MQISSIPFDFSRLQTPTTKARDERSELIQKFLDTLNSIRIQDGYAPYNFGRVARMLKGKTAFDLHRLYAECEDARNFSSMFHYRVTKPKA